MKLRADGKNSIRDDKSCNGDAHLRSENVTERNWGKMPESDFHADSGTK